MRNPFISKESGLTYEKETIADLLKNNLPDPFTGKEIKMEDFVPNLALKEIIQECQEQKAEVELKKEKN